MIHAQPQEPGDRLRPQRGDGLEPGVPRAHTNCLRSRLEAERGDELRVELADRHRLRSVHGCGDRMPPRGERVREVPPGKRVGGVELAHGRAEHAVEDYGHHLVRVPQRRRLQPLLSVVRGGRRGGRDERDRDEHKQAAEAAHRHRVSANGRDRVSANYLEDDVTIRLADDVESATWPTP